MGCIVSKGATSIPKSTVIEKLDSSSSIQTPPLDPPPSEQPQPQLDNVENFVVIWLDASIGSNTDTQKSKDQLQQFVNVVKIFTDPKECRTFINGVKDEKIFLIVSGALGEQFVPTIQEVTQIDSIYVFCSDKEKHETWTRNYPEVHGLYTSITPLCQQLGKDTKKSDHDLVVFEVIERSSLKTVTKTNQQEAFFMYDQLFKDIILAMKEEDMTDMYEFCRKHYSNNREEMKFLAELEKNYSDHSPVWWYSTDAFLYKILNKALRTHQYDTLYNLRVFIRHLHEEIVEQQKKTEGEDVQLYRGQGMEKADFDRIYANEGGLISFSYFLSTSSSREVALEFARDAREDRKKVSVLMELKVDKNTPVPFANISQLSSIETENEWLFSMGSIFRIGPAECLPDGTWLIRLTLTNENDQQLSALREHFKKSMQDMNACFNFARLMRQLAKWKLSEYFYGKSLETESVGHRRAVILNDLGSIRSGLEQYDEALDYYQQSLKLKQEHGGANHKGLASTYNNIATVYYKQKKMDLAIENLQRAVEAHNTALNANSQQLVAALYNNIATILNTQGKHDEALKYNKQCLDIQINTLPPIHPSLASTYNSISNTYHCLRSFTQAVEYAQKAIDIDIQALPPDHPQTELHKHNLKVIEQELTKSKLNYNSTLFT